MVLLLDMCTACQNLHQLLTCRIRVKSWNPFSQLFSTHKNTLTLSHFNPFPNLFLFMWECTLSMRIQIVVVVVNHKKVLFPKRKRKKKEKLTCRVKLFMKWIYFYHNNSIWPAYLIGNWKYAQIDKNRLRLSIQTKIITLLLQSKWRANITKW